jgi:phospholipase C
MTLPSRHGVLLAAAGLAILAEVGLTTACGSSGNPAQGAPDAAGTLDAGSVLDSTITDTGIPDQNEAGADWLAPPPITRQPEGTLKPLRDSCAFDAGAWPAETIGSEFPLGSDIPINHIIVIMQENRSFDHYLGRLVAQGYYQPGDFRDAAAPPPSDAGGDGGDDGGDDAGSAAVDAGTPGTGYAHNDQLDVPPPGWSNPDSDGGLVFPHPDNEYCYGVNHSWGAMHDDLDNGRLDHFVTQNNPDGQRTFFYEDDTVIPFYYALANTFSVGDRYFCSVLSSTWPNRYFLMAATSFGIGDNSACTVDTVANPAPQIFNLLDEGGHSWMDYTDGPHMLAFFPNFAFNQNTIPHYANLKCGLMTAIETGTLPDVSFVMGDEVTETSDEGPSNLPGIGGSVVEAVIRAVWASPEWKDTAVFITYDENGGLADHVPPAPACIPDGYKPHDVNNTPLPGAFDSTGYRVPFIVVSPYARAHYASHVVHDHTSITRFIEARFGLPALTARDANSMPPMEMFDFQNPPFMTPPTIAAHTTVPQAILTQCQQSMAPTSCGD